LYYDFQRWYDPSKGRFISPDRLAGYSSDPQGLNPYVYAENSPTNNLDPSGLECFSSIGDFGSCAGGFLYDNTVGAAINSYNWYTNAVVGASCVFAGCTGLALRYVPRKGEANCQYTLILGVCRRHRVPVTSNFVCMTSKAVDPQRKHSQILDRLRPVGEAA